MPGQLPVRGGSDSQRNAELPLNAGRDADERRDGRVRPPLAEERALELRVRAVEGLVVPVEAAAGLRDAEQEVDEDGAEECVVLGGITTRVRARVDSRRRLTGKLLERDDGVLPPAQARRARFDEVADERPVLVQHGAAPLVLLEGERQRLARVVELTEEIRERAEGEGTEGVVELRRARCHEDSYWAESPIPARRPFSCHAGRCRTSTRCDSHPPARVT